MAKTKIYPPPHVTFTRIPTYTLDDVLKGDYDIIVTTPGKGYFIHNNIRYLVDITYEPETFAVITDQSPMPGATITPTGS